MQTKEASWWHRIKKFKLNELNAKIKNNSFTLAAIACAFVVFRIFQISSWSLGAFFLAFYWNWLLSLKSIRRKAHHKKYRFSFIRLLLIINKLIEKIISVKFRYRKRVTRSLSPFLFFSIIYFLTGESFLIASVVGSYYFEIIRQVGEWTSWNQSA